MENNRLKVKQKLLIDFNYFNKDSFNDLIDINGEFFIINIINNKGEPLVIYTLEDSVGEDNNKGLGIYINDLVDLLYINSFIIVDIREVIKTDTRQLKYKK